jgi:site-specific DNA recombinase
VNLAAQRALRAAIYCRISLARFGDTLKVDDQEKLCREVSDRRGWAVGSEQIYVDNSRSAWRHDRKRPGWDAMLEAIGRGEVEAIVVYHGDRLIRQPWDLELLLRLAREKGIQLASPPANATSTTQTTSSSSASRPLRHAARWTTRHDD